MLYQEVTIDSKSAHPRGPVFLSYRHHDGTELATDLAWTLRSAGIPVWHDLSDLPPGDTGRRLEEAMQSGLSGAVLLVTPDIEASDCIKSLELPRLLVLGEQESFMLSIASTIEKEAGRLDHRAPDQLLFSEPSGILKGMRQDPALTPEDLAAIARNHCRQRMEALREEIESAGNVIDINVQTRFAPSSSDLRGDLIMRMRPPNPGDRRPNRKGLEEFQLSLRNLPYLLQTARAKHARFSGGAHLSVAFALGAALPTPLLQHVDVVDKDGHKWGLSQSTPVPVTSTQLLEVGDRSSHEAITGDVLVYVDLVPTPSDGAFERFLAADPSRFVKVFHIRAAAGGILCPEDASVIVAEASNAIRQAATFSEKSDVHLLLRCPWTVALLLGRTLNAVRVNLYELETGPDSDANSGMPRYVPSLVVLSGAGGSPIEKVVMPTRSEALA